MTSNDNNVQLKNYYNNNKIEFEKELVSIKTLIKKEDLQKQILH